MSAEVRKEKETPETVEGRECEIFIAVSKSVIDGDWPGRGRERAQSSVR